MMTDQRRREIHNRIRKMKKAQEQQGDHGESQPYTSSYPPSYAGSEDVKYPLFRKDLFLLKVLGAVLLFVGVALMYKYPTVRLEPARKAVASSFEKELQFAYITDWYEDTFGKPIAFLPSDREERKETVQPVNSTYAVPIAGSITEDFKSNGEGVLLKSGQNVKVGAIDNGTVIFAGKKEKWGNTVVLQHADQSESWYGNLKSLSVGLYEDIQKGQKLGVVSDAGSGNGKMFFAVKKNEAFIDPSQVITFE